MFAQVIARWVSAFLVMAEHVAGSVETGAHLTATATTAELPRRGSQAQTAAAAKLRGGVGVGGGVDGGSAGWPAAVKTQRRGSSPLPERVVGGGGGSVVRGVGGGGGAGGGMGGGAVKVVTEEAVAAEEIQLRHEQQVGARAMSYYGPRRP